MPMKPVVVRRWEVVGAFVFLIAAFVFALYLTNRESKKRSTQNRVLIESIQQSRAEITYTSCQDQNDRHDKTVSRLDELLRRRKLIIRNAIIKTQDLTAQTALRAQIDALDDARSSTVSILDALAPHQNCKQLVLDRFGYVPDIESSNP